MRQVHLLATSSQAISAVFVGSAISQQPPPALGPAVVEQDSPPPPAPGTEPTEQLTPGAAAAAAAARLRQSATKLSSTQATSVPHDQATKSTAAALLAKIKAKKNGGESPSGSQTSSQPSAELDVSLVGDQSADAGEASMDVEGTQETTPMETEPQPPGEVVEMDLDDDATPSAVVVGDGIVSADSSVIAEATIGTDPAVSAQAVIAAQATISAQPVIASPATQTSGAVTSSISGAPVAYTAPSTTEASTDPAVSQATTTTTDTTQSQQEQWQQQVREMLLLAWFSRIQCQKLPKYLCEQS